MCSRVSRENYEIKKSVFEGYVLQVTLFSTCSSGYFILNNLIISLEISRLKISASGNLFYEIVKPLQSDSKGSGFFSSKINLVTHCLLETLLVISLTVLFVRSYLYATESQKDSTSLDVKSFISRSFVVSPG